MGKHEIKIGDDVFTFTAEDDDLLFNSAESLNTKIKEHKEHYGYHTDQKKIIILAALNIINELEREKLEMGQNLSDLTEKINLLNEKLKVITE